MTNRVFVLGAGFSKAVAPSMPTVAGLAEWLRHELSLSRFAGPPWSTLRAPMDAPPEEPWTDDVETLLGFLATPQPHLTDVENASNAATFEHLAVELAAHIHWCQRQISVPPDWLDQLVRIWHRSRAFVITLNYDVIIEQAVIRAQMLEGRDKFLAPVHVLATDVPDIAQRTHAVLAHTPTDTFRLAKLHGSIDWVSPGLSGSPGDLQYRLRILHPDTGDLTDRDLAGERRRAAGGLVPSIIPPTPAKNSYLTTRQMRALWGEARFALAEAHEVHIVGYSMPPNDTQIASLLAGSIGASQVFYWNLDSHFARNDFDRARRLLDAPQRGITVSGQLSGDAVPAMVHWLRDAEDRT